MDYKKLLVNYMALVIGNEGIDYLDYVNDVYRSGVKFADAEIAELKQLALEALTLAGH